MLSTVIALLLNCKSCKPPRLLSFQLLNSRKQLIVPDNCDIPALPFFSLVTMRPRHNRIFAVIAGSTAITFVALVTFVAVSSVMTVASISAWDPLQSARAVFSIVPVMPVTSRRSGNC
jgi:hypothetical protein